MVVGRSAFHVAPYPTVSPGAIERTAGAGLQHIRQAGIDVASGVLEQEARELNIGFVSRITRGRPWTRLKIAASLDGKTALNNGSSQWITGAAARRASPGSRIRGALVQRMETGLGEGILGFRHDPQTGPTIVVGAGGTLAAIYRDVVVLL